MQAVSIYILIRLDEGPTEENDFDSLLLAVVVVSSTASSSMGQLSNKTSFTGDFQATKVLRSYPQIARRQSCI